MKANTNYTLRHIGNICFIVCLKGKAFPQNQIIHTNETGAFLWECLQQECTIKELLAAIQSEYNVDKQTALADIHSFLEQLKKISAIEGSFYTVL